MPQISKFNPELALRIYGEITAADTTVECIVQLRDAIRTGESQGVTTSVIPMLQPGRPRTAPETPVEQPDHEDADPGEAKRGWQHVLSSDIENYFKENDVLPMCSQPRKALLRS